MGSSRKVRNHSSLPLPNSSTWTHESASQMAMMSNNWCRLQRSILGSSNLSKQSIYGCALPVPHHSPVCPSHHWTRMLCPVYQFITRLPWRFPRHQGQVGHRGGRVPLKFRLDPTEVTGLANPQLNQTTARRAGQQDQAGGVLGHQGRIRHCCDHSVSVVNSPNRALAGAVVCIVCPCEFWDGVCLVAGLSHEHYLLFSCGTGPYHLLMMALILSTVYGCAPRRKALAR